jgi:hypothetical protein
MADRMTHRRGILTGLASVGVVCSLLTALFMAWRAPAAPTPPRYTTDRELGLKGRGTGGSVADMIKSRRIADDNALYECVVAKLPALRGCKRPVTPTETRGETEIERPGRDLMTWWFVQKWDGADIFEDPCVDDPRKRLVEFPWQKERDYYVEQRKRREVGYGPVRTSGVAGPVAVTSRRPRRCRKPLKPRPDCKPTRGGRITCGVSPRNSVRGRVELTA